MRFVCICMSPALDATVRLPAWPVDGAIAKNVREDVNIGGKAINVARWIGRRLEAEGAARGTVVCGGLLGRDNARPFEENLAASAVAARFVHVPGETRRNEMFVTPSGSFKVNRVAFPGLVDDAAPTAAQIVETCYGADTGMGPVVAVLSGSLPPCCGDDFYAQATRELRVREAVVVLDASGEPLRQAVMNADASMRPHVIKPNADECEVLTGFVPRTPDEFRRATEMLQARVPHVIISDGGAGCWFDGMFIPAPKVEVLDTTAAGDTLLAEWCFRTFGAAGPIVGNGLENARAAGVWAVAAGSAACTMPGGDPPSAAFVAELATRDSHCG